MPPHVYPHPAEKFAVARDAARKGMIPEIVEDKDIKKLHQSERYA
jgi:hypothetical protein